MYNTKIIILVSFLITTILSFTLFLKCSSETTEPTAQETMNLTGSWELTSTIAANTCGIQSGETNTEIIDLTDNNGTLSIVNFDGLWGNGQFDGTNMQFTGAETSDNFGCLATINTEGNGSISGADLVGSFTMMVDYDASCGNFTDCTINSDFVMKKMEDSPCLGRANFGDPQNSNYILPYIVGTSYSVYQSYCWSTGGHRNQLAYDFTMSIGDTVIASRGGIIRAVKEDSPDNGEGYGEHNYVYIQHTDGTSAFYAHLKQNSVIVEPNDTVSTGQYFALSGNSGQSGEPHLHIGVYENYPPVEGVDIPFNFKNAEGLLDSRGGLIGGEFYKALPY
jgi:murein DD-endopeptidase MepM/ murein hydrolase activator NlpD